MGVQKPGSHSACQLRLNGPRMEVQNTPITSPSKKITMITCVGSQKELAPTPCPKQTHFMDLPSYLIGSSNILDQPKKLEASWRFFLFVAKMWQDVLLFIQNTFYDQGLRMPSRKVLMAGAKVGIKNSHASCFLFYAFC